MSGIHDNELGAHLILTSTLLRYTVQCGFYFPLSQIIEFFIYCEYLLSLVLEQQSGPL